jgi:hypothetical protein
MEKTQESLKRENNLNDSFTDFQVEKVLALNESINGP